jgi:hypothetical protein
MTWIPALAAAGGILALGPILIHIIFRRRFRSLDFAAMRFLFESLKRTKQRMRIEELIIILLRVLACLLIGFMLANIRAASDVVQSAAPTAHVFVLDDSMSMAQQVGTTTLFQKALTDLSRRIEAAPDADLVSVISASRPTSGEPLGRLVPSIDLRRDNFTSRLAAIKPTDMSARFAEAFHAVSKLIATQENMPVRVYVISDFRHKDFAGAEHVEAIQDAIGTIEDESIEFLLLDFGLPCKQNLSVTDVRPERKIAVSGVELPFRVVVRNTGTSPSEATKMDVRVGDAELPPLEVPELEPGASAEIQTRFTMNETGGASFRFVLPVDALEPDNDAACGLYVRDAINVLIVDGSPNPGHPSSASFCLAYALDPSGKGTFGQRVHVVQADTWNAARLRDYDLVLLTNVRDFAVSRNEEGRAVYPVLEALEAYVSAGGGLGIFVGDRVSAEFYNGPFFDGGRGLCPLKLDPRPVPEPDPAVFNRLDPLSIGNAHMLRIFTGRSEQFSKLIRFYLSMRALAASGQGDDKAGLPQVLAAFDDAESSPAVCRRVYGQGTVIMWYTAADTRWSNWPKDLSFLPVINDMAWDLVRAADNDFIDRVGRRISYALPSHLSSASSVTLKTPRYPDEEIYDLPIFEERAQKIVAFANTTAAGIYNMTVTLPDRSRHNLYFSRLIDPEESKLQQATESQLRTALNRPFRYFPRLAIREAETEDLAPRKSFWWLFMLALVPILGLETFLAQRFGHYKPLIQNAREPVVR